MEAWETAPRKAHVQVPRAHINGDRVKLSSGTMHAFGIVYPTFCKVEIDRESRRVAFTFSVNRGEGWSLVSRDGFVYLRGAMEALGVPNLNKTFELEREGDRAVLKL